MFCGVRREAGDGSRIDMPALGTLGWVGTEEGHKLVHKSVLLFQIPALQLV
jgi:hypothetical protein